MNLKNFYFLIFAFACSSSVFAQSTIWTKSDDSRIQLTQYMERRTVPQQYDVWQADFEALKKILDKAPMEFTNAQPLVFEIPLPQYGLVKFKIEESPVYAPQLRAKYPIFKSFSAVGADRAEFNARFDYTLNGFHALINTPEGEVYIDPFATEQTAFYIAYFAKNHERKDVLNVPLCGNKHEDSHFIDEKNPFEHTAVERSSADLVTIRKYRLALVATGEFSQKHGGTKPKVLSQLVTLANRCNKKFNDEVAIRFELVAKNDTIIFLDPATDPFPKGNLGSAILGLSTSVIKPRIGDANYDMGHSLTGGCTDVGGVANGGVICTGNKGGGMSCDQGGSTDQFAMTIMCHEMGHQFSASHTMSSCDGVDQNQVSSSSAIEPGSGSTIMSYDGSCGSSNVTGKYWHELADVYSVGSLEQIMDFSRTQVGNSCPERITSTNHIPSINIPLSDGFSIPIGTPFELTAIGSDEDNNPLLYSWEQADGGAYVPLGTKKTQQGNTFRVFAPISSPTRLFPKLSEVLSGNATKVELLPDTTRTYTFRCTARDNSANGGGTIWDEVVFKSSHLAGPFKLTYPNAVTDTMQNSEYTVIKWDVANTDKAPVNCKRVNIFLSTDGGNTFPITLLKNTINDGSEGVIIPSNITGSKVRVKIAAADNIFLNISKKDATVVNSTKVGYTVTASSEQYIVCLPDVAKINIQTSAYGGFNQKVKLSVVSGLPQGATSTFSKDEIASNESSELAIDMQKVTTPGLYSIKVSAIAGTDTLFRTVSFNTIYANFDDLALATPADGSSGNTTLPSFKWNPAAVADSYDFELASNPTFDANSIVFKKSSLKPTDIAAPATLNENSVYFWRVKAKNSCRNGDFSIPYAFSTLVQTCKEYKKEDKLNTLNQNTVESAVNVLETGKVSDINIVGIKGYHDDFGDLVMSVVSPSGKTSTLFSKKCTTISPSFNMSFDDEAASGFNCSALSGAPNFKPQTTLGVFDGEDIQGDWKLKIEDTKAGNGGNITNWGLKFCFATSVTAPSLIKNDTLRVKKGLVRYIDISTLAASDDKSPVGKITFTLVKTPENGTVSKWITNNLKVGDSFTQEELANGTILRYTDDGSKTAKHNSFLFVVTDGEGGFIGTYRYNIVRDEKAPTVGTTSIDIEKSLSVYPNPTNQALNVSWSGDTSEKITLGLYNIQGQNIENKVFDGSNFNTQFNVQHLPNGVYLLKVNTTQGIATKKIVVNH